MAFRYCILFLYQVFLLRHNMYSMQFAAFTVFRYEIQPSRLRPCHSPYSWFQNLCPQAEACALFYSSQPVFSVIAYCHSESDGSCISRKWSHEFSRSSHAACLSRASNSLLIILEAVDAPFG